MSKGPRQLLGAAGLYLMSTLITKGVGLALVPVYTRLLSPAEYGTVTLSEAAAGIVVVVGALGIPAGYSRLVFAASSSQNALGPTSLAALVVGLLGALGTALVIWPSWISGWISVALFPFVAIALGTGTLTQISELFLRHLQATSRHRVYVGVTLAGFGVATATSLTLVVGARLGPLGLLVGRLCGVVALAFLLIPVARAYFWGKRPDAKETWGLLRFTLPLVPYQLSLFLIQLSDQFVVDILLGAAHVGVYAVGYSLGMVMQVFNAALHAAWYPMFYRWAAESRQAEIAPVIERLCLMLGLIACVGTLIAKDFVGLVFDERFHDAWTVVPFVIAGYMFHGYFALFQLSLLQVKRSAAVAVITALALVLNIALNFWLIPHIGIVGAAVGTAAAYFLEAVLTIIIAQRVFPLPVSHWKLLVPIGMLGVATVAAVIDAGGPVLALFVRGSLVACCLGGVVWVALRLRQSIR